MFRRASKQKLILMIPKTGDNTVASKFDTLKVETLFAVRIYVIANLATFVAPAEFYGSFSR
jgi:hypothetical protein